MAEEASVGLPVKIGWLIGVHSERDPDALLLRARTLLGTNVARGPHYHVESTLCAQPVRDGAKAPKGTSEGGFPCLFLNGGWSRSRLYYGRVLTVVSDEISERREP